MAYLLIGTAATATFLLLADFVRRRRLHLSWWQWALTVLGILYAVFVLAAITSFLEEGTPMGAVVMGTILGFVAVLWGVLLGRFVFLRAARSPDV
jgi:hypothetical protein